jgi:heme A synthase
MTDPLPRFTPRWVHALTLLTVSTTVFQLALGSHPFALVANLGLVAICAALELCCDPKLIRPWAILSVAATFVLLAVGQFVTSFGAGMADPVWPTEPWYVFHTATEGEKQKFREQFGFFIEHTHRIVGWTVGGLVSVLAVGVLWTEPRKVARWVALAGLAVLIVGYGEFHRAMMAQRERPAAEVVLPVRSVGTALAGLVVMFGAVASGLFVRARGTGLRLYAALALVAVMIQGLLGGFRVKLNELVGTDLAAFHGVFAQVVFGLLVTVAVLSGAGAGARSRASRWAMALAHLIFLQVIFGAWVRHFPGALPQRLHFLTAFAATAVAVWVLRSVFTDPRARARGGWVTWALAALIVLQLYLGVEAWLARFGQYVPPELVKVTPENGAIRSFHALVGSGVWGAALALALRLRTAGATVTTLEPVGAAAPGKHPVVARAPEEAQLSGAAK